MAGYLLDRAGEPSTWRGLALLLSAVGIGIEPDMMESITATGMAVSGLIGVLTKD